MQRLDIASGPESDIEDTEEYRLYLEDSDSSPKKYEYSIKGENGLLEHGRDESRVRMASTCSDRSTPSPSRETANRKTSQTLADAFLEQLPEVRNYDDAYQNGSATHEERGAC
ncbi:hypothetical protein OTU49_003722 [Cherax quadricarinatus]|uniref:Uncharacterized protein n=2 Tax=Cherax quadricarinatus TaxID=27406 RepID=A0AAW0XEW3_CHEQU